MPSIPEHYFKIGGIETKVDDLRAYVNHSHHLVRLKVAEHPGSPDDVLQQLAVDEHPEIRIAVSEHPRAPFNVLKQLAMDTSVDVRYALAENHALPPDLLKQLAHDENAYVSARASQTLDKLG